MSETPIDLDELIEGSQRLSQESSDHPLLDGLLEDSLVAFISEEDPAISLSLWIELFSGSGAKHTDIKRYLSRYIGLLDELLIEQLNTILHHEKFQRLEASWRGIEQLIAAAIPYKNVKIRLLDVSWREITRDIDRAVDFDQTALFELVYNQEFGMPGGQPYGCLLGDYQVQHRPSKQHPYDDVGTLRGIAAMSAASFAPFICGASPALFGIDEFESLGNPINMASLFQQQEYTSWRSLREMSDSRFIGVTLPRVLMREPYENKILDDAGLLFIEQMSDGNSNHYLWGNACYAMGVVLIREFGDVGWFSHIRGVPRDYAGGGLVTSFPSLDYGTDGVDVAQKIVTQVIITDSRERELSELGYLCLCDCYDTPFAAFQSCPSLQKPRQYSSSASTANARMSAMLQQILCASRFAQYIKVMIREKVGSFTTANDCERLLQRWLDTYTTGRDDLEWDALSRFPLRSARVQVRELPGKPGVYNSIIHLTPHYVVDHLVSELKLTTELSQVGFGTRY